MRISALAERMRFRPLARSVLPLSTMAEGDPTNPASLAVDFRRLAPPAAPFKCTAVAWPTRGPDEIIRPAVALPVVPIQSGDQVGLILDSTRRAGGLVSEEPVHVGHRTRDARTATPIEPAREASRPAIG